MARKVLVHRGATAPTAAHKQATDPSCPAVKQACKTLSSGGGTKHYTAGLLAYGGEHTTTAWGKQGKAQVSKHTQIYAHMHQCCAGLLFAAGAAAWSLPVLFLLFAAVCLPWRAVSFCKQKWVSPQTVQGQVGSLGTYSTHCEQPILILLRSPFIGAATAAAVAAAPTVRPTRHLTIGDPCAGVLPRGLLLLCERSHSDFPCMFPEQLAL